MGSTLEDESNSEDGSYDSELSVSDSGSESDADTYPTPAPSQVCECPQSLRGCPSAPRPTLQIPLFAVLIVVSRCVKPMGPPNDSPRAQSWYLHIML